MHSDDITAVITPNLRVNAHVNTDSREVKITAQNKNMQGLEKVYVDVGPLGDISAVQSNLVNNLYLYFKQRLIDEGFSGGGGAPTNTVTNYRSIFNDPYLYTGYIYNGASIIERQSELTNEAAQGVTDLETYWTNRETLTYS